MHSSDLSIYMFPHKIPPRTQAYITYPRVHLQPQFIVIQMMMMGQEAKLVPFEEVDEARHNWVFMDDDNSDLSVSSFSGGSDESTTTSDSFSSSSSDLMEDASSTPSLSNGPLYDMSHLMSHLPIKRGLSKYYQGKSQSFTSLAIVRNKEDLVKKESPYKRKRKSKSYGNMMNKHSYSPKATIAKKVPRGRSFLSSSILTKTPSSFS